MEYEYGIGHTSLAENIDGAHRQNMTLEEAQAWLDKLKDDGYTGDAYFLIRRPRGPWERFSTDSTDQSNSGSTNKWRRRDLFR